MPNAEKQFSPQIPAQSPYNNAALNSFGSNYASTYGQPTTQLIARQIRYEIFDAAPQGYYDDLKILKMNGVLTKNSDEFFYEEKQFGRDAIQATANVAAAVTQTIPVSANSTTVITKDINIVYPNNQKGTVTNVDTVANTITVTALTGQTLPAVTANDLLSQLSTITGDGRNNISTYMRLNVIERYNYVQLFARATRFGKLEMYKYKNAGTTDYLAKNKQEMLNQIRIDYSNCYWNGQIGQATLSDGQVVKTMGGIYPTMIAAGSPQIATTTANIKAALAEAVFSTQYGSIANSSSVKFLYGTPRMIHAVQQAYKETLTRYFPQDMNANLRLNQITFEGNTVVLVSVQRFQEISCFPASWAGRMFLLDQPSIKAVELWGDSMGETPDRYDGSPNLNTYKDFWVDGQLSQEFSNPLSSAVIDVSA